MVCMRLALLAGLFAGVTSSMSGCMSNTVDLVDDDGTGADGSGSGSGTADGADDGRPTTTVTMTTATTATDDTGPAPGIEDGWWLMAIEPVPVATGLPLQFLVQVLQVSPGSYNIAIQSLSLDQGSTTSPRQPVGEVHTYGGLALGGGAPLQFYTGTILIPGAANPITGSDLSIDIYIDGMQLGDPYCGTVSGVVLEPIQADLTGSTFATTRLTATDPASLPVDFPVACP